VTIPAALYGEDILSKANELLPGQKAEFLALKFSETINWMAIGVIAMALLSRVAEARD
jgi:hypothetical protein